MNPGKEPEAGAVLREAGTGGLKEGQKSKKAGGGGLVEPPFLGLARLSRRKWLISRIKRL
jgi:hypothetical protein